MLLRTPFLSRRAVLAGASAFLAGCTDTGAPLPVISLPPLPGMMLNTGFAVAGVDTARFDDNVTLLNVWASWCPICRSEHDMLKRLSGDGRFRMAGLVYRDNAEAARAYLGRDGNPYGAVSVDTGGVLSKALGVRGVPYTFVIDKQRRAIAQVIGALNDANVASVIMPAVHKALTASIT